MQRIPDSVRSVILHAITNNPNKSYEEFVPLFGVCLSVIKQVAKDGGVTRPRGPRKGWKQLVAKAVLNG
jgi:hypothetical protein